MVIATPIGNLEDLSIRARESLITADLIACEDTRRTGRLMAHLGVKRPLLSLHEHNERGRLPQVIRALEEGKTIALVSDAGTPLLSDPGFLAVRACVDHGAQVAVVPGPSAALTALVVSGLAPIPHTFLGFPPVKTGKRRRFYERWGRLEHTLILFESPHRLIKSLLDLQAILGDRKIAVARELTKIHEEVVRGSCTEVLEILQARERIRGEIVLVVSGDPAVEEEQPTSV